MFRSVVLTLEMIKFQHTLFALPFAFLAAFTAANGVPKGWTIVWILCAMVGARSAAMAFNRLVDAHIDAANPRTETRALPAGLVSRNFVILFVLASASLFFYAAYRLNPLAFALSPVAMAIILGYSFTKRFTSLSHLVLGLALAIAPAGAWIAVRGEIDFRVLPLAIAVLFWTAGFDTLYSLQDIEFDRNARLFSIPAAVGPKRALTIARLFHVVTLMALAAYGIVNGFGVAYFAGVGAATVLVVWQHTIISPSDLSRINAAFFTANGVLSIVLFALGACDILIRP